MFKKALVSSIIFIAIFALFPTVHTVVDDGNIAQGSEFPIIVSPALTFDTNPSVKPYMTGLAASDPVRITGFPVRTSYKMSCAVCHKLIVYPVGFAIDAMLGGLIGWGLALLITMFREKRSGKNE